MIDGGKFKCRFNSELERRLRLLAEESGLSTEGYVRQLVNLAWVERDAPGSPQIDDPLPAKPGVSR